MTKTTWCLLLSRARSLTAQPSHTVLSTLFVLTSHRNKANQQKANLLQSKLRGSLVSSGGYWLRARSQRIHRPSTPGLHVGCSSLCTNKDRCQPRLTGGGGSAGVWKYGSRTASALPESTRLTWGQGSHTDKAHPGPATVCSMIRQRATLPITNWVFCP